MPKVDFITLVAIKKALNFTTLTKKTEFDLTHLILSYINTFMSFTFDKCNKIVKFI